MSDTAPRPEPAARTASAVVVGSVLALAAATVVIDVVAEQLAGRAVVWPVASIASGLRSTTWTATWVLAAGVAAVLVGLGLMAAAVSPGRPATVVVDAGPGERAALSRRSLRRAVTAAAASVDGVSSAALQLRRGRAEVTVSTPFRDPGATAAAVEEAVRSELVRLGVSRPPAVSVRVRTAGRP